MSTINWRRVDEIFAQALAQPEAERIAFLDRVCQGEPDALRDHVERLLLSPDGDDSLCKDVEQVFAATARAIDEALGHEPPISLPYQVNEDIRLVRYVGGGGIGDVYEASDKNLGRVALKVVQRRHLNDPEVVRLFESQVPLMARLHHANIVQVHGVGQFEGRPYFTMNFIEGSSLQDHLDEFGRDPRRAAQLVLKVTRAILHAHQREIIHRDLKPANILLDTTGEPIVTDLDLARHLGDALEFRGGTLPYMSREQASGVETTTLSDVYGLGAVLYALLTGRPPFWHKNREVLLDMVRDPSVRPESPRRLNQRVDPDKRVDPDLEAICLKCLEKDPTRRYQSAAGLAEDLEHWLAGRRPRIAVPRNVPYDLWRWIKHHPFRAAAIAAGVLLVALLYWVVARSSLHAREQQMLQGNLSTARSVANTFGAVLKFWSSAVLREAKEVGLRDDLQKGELGKLKDRMEKIDLFYNDPTHGFARAQGESPFASWFITDGKGVVLAHGKVADIVKKGQSTADRDYFRGACKTKAGSLHVSRVYLGRAAGPDYKFALAAPIWEKEKLLGVLVATVMTDSAEETLLPKEAPQKAVLIGRWDGTPPEKPDPELRRDLHHPGQRLILLHPAFVKGDRAVEIHNERLLEDQGAAGHALDDRYEDPVATKDPSFAGRWLAAAAAVPGTEFAVIVQQEYEAVQAEAIMVGPLILWLIILALVLVGATSMAWAVRRRNRLPAPTSEVADPPASRGHQVSTAPYGGDGNPSAEQVRSVLQGNLHEESVDRKA